MSYVIPIVSIFFSNILFITPIYTQYNNNLNKKPIIITIYPLHNPNITATIPVVRVPSPDQVMGFGFVVAACGLGFRGVGFRV